MKDKRLQRNVKQHLSSSNRGRITATFHKRRLILENEDFDDTNASRHQTSIQDFFCVKGRGVGLTPKPETRRYANPDSNNKFRRALNIIDPNSAPAATSSPPALSETLFSAPNTDEEFDVHRADCAPVVAVIASSPRNVNPPRRTPSPFPSPSHTTAGGTTARRRGRRLEQLYLDLGQRDFARPVVCETCGMLHVHGVEEDVRDHRRICQVHALGVPLRTERRIVERPHPDSAIHLVRRVEGFPFSLFVFFQARNWQKRDSADLSACSLTRPLSFFYCLRVAHCPFPDPSRRSTGASAQGRASAGHCR